ncbi:hypothetical protein ACJX0J_038311 [Zea mays]
MLCFHLQFGYIFHFLLPLGISLGITSVTAKFVHEELILNLFLLYAKFHAMGIFSPVKHATSIQDILTLKTQIFLGNVNTPGTLDTALNEKHKYHNTLSLFKYLLLSVSAILHNLPYIEQKIIARYLHIKVSSSHMVMQRIQTLIASVYVKFSKITLGGSIIM